MSAIAGLLHLDGRPANAETIGAMTDAIAHRGPDGGGTWNDGPVAFGHQLLHVTPESLHEQQPVVRGSRVLTADARIDNRDELDRALRLPRLSEGDVRTDPEYILAAYEKWGEDCVDHLVGAFAFALWDGDRKRMIVARDPMGIKPLFFYHRPGRAFAFATEIKSLLALEEVSRELDEERIAELLFLRPISGERTIYREVRHFQHAHMCSVGPEHFAYRPYWRPEAGPELRLSSDAEYAEAFREQMTEAVRCRMRSAFPITSALSGGLDSSTIACLARDILAERGEGPLDTLSCIFPGASEADLEKIDERKYMEAVVDAGGIRPHYVRGDLSSPMEAQDQYFWHGDEPYWGPNVFLHWEMWREASALGSRVFLDGLDGDSTVSHGWDFLIDLAYGAQWDRFEEVVGALIERNDYRPDAIIRQFGLSGLRAAAEAGQRRRVLSGALQFRRRFGIPLRSTLKFLVPDEALRRLFALRGRSVVHNPTYRSLGPNEFVAPEFAQRFSMGGTAEPTPYLSMREGHADQLADAQFPHTLSLTDRFAAAFRIEPRYPFFDKRLVEFCVSLPAEQRLGDGWTRLIMRRAMEGILPPAVQWRLGKASLGSNFKDNLVEKDRDRILDVARSVGPRTQQYLNVEAFGEVWERVLAGRSRSHDYASLYSMTLLGSWLSEQAPEPVEAA